MWVEMGAAESESAIFRLVNSSIAPKDFLGASQRPG